MPDLIFDAKILWPIAQQLHNLWGLLQYITSINTKEASEAVHLKLTIYGIHTKLSLSTVNGILKALLRSIMVYHGKALENHCGEKKKKKNSF